jgi:glucose/mannose-6-phosphate isomerase
VTLKINLTPERLHSLDASDMLGKTLELPQQIRTGIDLSRAFLQKHKLEKIGALDWFGLGGSAVAGDLLQAFGFEPPAFPLHIFVQRFPRASAERRLVCSYSGNTIESVQAFTDVAPAQVWMTMSSGGRMQELAERANVPHLALPTGYPPRAATGFMLGAMISIFESVYGFGADDYEASLKALDEDAKSYRLLDPAVNRALTLATKLIDRTPVIYTVDGLTMPAVANRFRTQLAENSKVWSHAAHLPEMAHNEVESLAFLSQLLPPPLVILLGSWNLSEKLTDPRPHLSRIFDSLPIQHETIDPRELWPESSSRWASGLRTLLLLDAMSMFLAVLKAVDPMDIPVIAKLKADLTRTCKP